MKVYTHIVMDMTQEHVPVIEEESFSYDGDVSLCSGGGGGGDQGAPDSYYRRKANVAERQQDIAEEKHEFWSSYQKPLEKQKLAANEELLPQMTDLKETQIGFKQDKLDVQQEGLGLQSDMISKKQSIMDDMGSLGLDARMNQAEATVTQEFEQNQEEAKRSMSRMGVDPTSGKFQDMEQDMAIEKASAEAGARNQARSKSKQMGFGLMGG